jgi:asparagine synthase (glutamine-hydrolysing)
MCGIAGAFGFDQPDDARIARTLALMRHRGPDGHGVLRTTINNHVATLLHTRLSIIDLDPRASQPMERDGLVVSFNGEIYNYLEIRCELEARHVRFTTSSDTEVLLEAYEAWGAAAFDRLEGMWALALIDRRNQTLVLSRDRFGEKPLYTMVSDGTLYFASEIKTLAELAGAWPAVDYDYVARSLVLGYRFLQKRAAGFYKNVVPFPAASFAVVNGPEPPSAQRYWSLSCRPRPMTADDAAEGVRDRLKRSVELRMRADVPLAFCLSGGLDSSALVAFAARVLGRDVHAFSIIESDPRYDESRNISASVTAFGCHHHAFTPTQQGFLDRLARQTAYHDVPVATISYYLHNFLSEAIAGGGFKVAVSGTAADELFTGYYDHYLFWLAGQHGRKEFDRLVGEWRESYGRFVRNPMLQDPLRFVQHPKARDHITLGSSAFRDLMREPVEDTFDEMDYADDLLRNRMMNELFHEVIPVLLAEDDLNSMQWSVENRSPYLDRDLVEFAYSIPAEHLIRDGYVKWPLRAALAGVLPDQVRLDKQKRGFNGSITSLLDLDDEVTRDRLLAPGPIFDIMDRDKFLRFAHEADTSDNSVSKFLFSFASTRIFLDQHG